jgi:hypothetical protein
MISRFFWSYLEFVEVHFFGLEKANFYSLVSSAMIFGSFGINVTTRGERRQELLTFCSTFSAGRPTKKILWNVRFSSSYLILFGDILLKLHCMLPLDICTYYNDGSSFAEFVLLYFCTFVRRGDLCTTLYESA